jgi:hypothetical protein
MSIQRSTIVRGPCQAQYGGVTIYSKGDISLPLNLKTFDLPTDSFGIVDKRVDAIDATAQITSSGAMISLLPLLSSYATKNIGDSIFGADTPLTIWTRAGVKLVFAAAALTKLPDITFASNKTLLGAMTFTFLHADNTDWSAANSLVAVTQAAYPGDAGFDVSQIITQKYGHAWGAVVPWSAFETETGGVMSFNVEIEPVTIDSCGIVDYTLKNLSVMYKCKPVGIAETDYITALLAQGAGASRGRSLKASANHLNISGTGIYGRVYNAALQTGGFKFGPTTLRQDEVGFVANRSVTAGALDPLYYLGSTAPV